MSRGIIAIISLTFCVFLLISDNVFAAPQRSIQLGGTGPRPVGLGAPPPGPNYQQQLAFGPPQQQQQQFVQAQPQPQHLRIRPQSPVTIQQGIGGQPPIGSFPIPANPRQQPIILRSPPVAATPAASEEEEYEEDDFEEPPKPVAIPQPQQRVPPRVTQPQQFQQQTLLGQPGPGPQRFVVPQQQPHQTQVTQRRPQPQTRTRIVQQVQRPLTPAVAQQVQQTPQPQRQQILQQQPGRLSLGQDSRFLAANAQGSGKDRLSATPPPIQTIDRFNRQNEDGSITWGYVNEDGTFKEETLGADCVVRGKYGYVDPDGMKREYEYQSGNPCDPNKRGQPEEDDELVLAGPQQQQQLQQQQRLAGLINARPVGQLQQQPRRQQQLQQQQLQ